MAARKRATPTAADLDRTLAALAAPERRRAIELLGAGPLAAGELARALDLPAPAMSRHLRILRQSGLVEETHPAYDARVRVYSLRFEPALGLKAWLEQTERLWALQLRSFKAYVEAKGERR